MSTPGYGGTLGSTYGSNYGGLGGYGGGYGGYGGGYGGYSRLSGGYGGGFGGYNSFGTGGNYGAGGMMDPQGNMGWLSSFNQIVGSVGQITEVGCSARIRQERPVF